MTGEVLVVISDGLNIRELPESGAKALAVLPKGQEVHRVDDRKWNTDWLRVETDMGATRFTGYVMGRYVKAPEATTPHTPAITGATLARQFEQGLKNYWGVTSLAYLTAKRKRMIASVAPLLAEKLQANGLVTAVRLAHFLGQTGAETNFFDTLVEYGNDAYFKPYENRRDLGNTEPGDGARFRGRGLIQLTGRDNYSRASHGLGLGEALVEHPERIGAEPQLAVDTALWFWTKNNINAVCDRPGTLDAVSLAVSRAVNLGNPDSTKAPRDRDKRRKLTEAGLSAFSAVTS